MQKLSFIVAFGLLAASVAATAQAMPMMTAPVGALAAPHDAAVATPEDIASARIEKTFLRRILGFGNQLVAPQQHNGGHAYGGRGYDQRSYDRGYDHRGYGGRSYESRRYDARPNNPPPRYGYQSRYQQPYQPPRQRDYYPARPSYSGRSNYY